MSHPARLGYLFTQMTQNTFLAVAILNAAAVLYPHYATLVRTWGSSAIEDQRLPGGFMLIAGDAVFLTALMLTVAAWMRASEPGSASAHPLADEEPTLSPLPQRTLATAPRAATQPTS